MRQAFPAGKEHDAMPFGFRSAIVDMDGVILDSLGVWEEVDRAFLAAHGLEGRTDVLERLSRSPTLQEAAAFLADNFIPGMDSGSIAKEFNSLLGSFYAHSIAPMPGAIERICAFKANGVKTALVSAASEELAIPALVRIGILDKFDFLLCNADKTRPETFLDAANRLGAMAGETAVFDDLEQIRAVAAKLGFKTYPSLEAAK